MKKTEKGMILTPQTPYDGGKFVARSLDDQPYKWISHGAFYNRRAIGNIVNL